MVALDVDGDIRPFGGGPDLGADEWTIRFLATKSGWASPGDWCAGRGRIPQEMYLMALSCDRIANLDLDRKGQLRSQHGPKNALSRSASTRFRPASPFDIQSLDLHQKTPGSP